MPSVLVVDDDAGIVELIKQILEDAGYSVVTARDGKQALDLVQVCHPDAVVTDLMMPRVDGATLCWQLKSNPTTRSTVVMLMSAVSNAAALIRKCPADAFLAKPFDVDEIVSMVRRHIGPRDQALA